MKNLSSLRLLFAATLASMVILSCQREPSAPLAPLQREAEDSPAGKYTKLVVLQEGGQNAIALEISTDHADMLNWFTANDLTLFSPPTEEAADQEIEVGSLENTVEATEAPAPERLVVIRLKKVDRDDRALLFSNTLQDRLNAVGATIRFVMESDEVAERGPIGGSPKRIKLNKNQPSKPAFVYIRWRCANSFYLGTHNWPANNGTSAIYNVCPACTSATRYFYHYDYYCSAYYSTVFLSWQNTACN